MHWKRPPAPAGVPPILYVILGIYIHYVTWVGVVPHALRGMLDVCVVFTLNRSFYPTTSVHPVSALILHPREIQIMWSQTVRQKYADELLNALPGAFLFFALCV